jgi:hypothetical protein
MFIKTLEGGLINVNHVVWFQRAPDGLGGPEGKPPGVNRGLISIAHLVSGDRVEVLAADVVRALKVKP